MANILDAIRYVENGEPDEALRIASQILNDEPEQVDAICVAGQALLNAERYGLAYNLYKRALELRPDISGIWNNIGLVCMKMMRDDEARKYLTRSLNMEPDNTAALNNMALIEVNNGNPQGAVVLGNKSLSINPDQSDVRETLGYANLMLGNWEAGWDGYEAMVGTEKHRTFPPRKDRPYWNGELGLTLNIRGEQGIGDEISFASMIPDVSRDNKVVLECDARLYGLFKRSFPDIKVYPTRFEKSPEWVDSQDFDAWCLVGSLGWHYRVKSSDFSGIPYLKACPERKSHWKAELSKLGNRKKVGIAWNGGLKDTFKARRSLDLEQLLPILSQDCTFISLEYKKPHELADFEQEHGIKIHHFPEATESRDYDDTAALVDELDLVISVQTAVVHLAGALGKPCWTLTPNKPNWRYATPRFMWSESVELFRQGKAWDEPIKSIVERLHAYCSGLQA
jgi:lipoprotein NlpI